MAPKAKCLAKAKVVVCKGNAHGKAQCKAKGEPLDTDSMKGHKGVEQERMNEMVKGVPQMPHNGQQVGTSVRTSRGDPRRWRRPWRPKQLPEHNYRRTNEMTELDKAKADLIKNIQKNLMVMERDNRALIRLADMDKSKLPTILHPSVNKYHKINTSQITTLIITLHEIKPLDLSHADTDKYWKLVDKILKVRDEYMECMKTGKALLEMA